MHHLAFWQHLEFKQIAVDHNPSLVLYTFIISVAYQKCQTQEAYKRTVEVSK